LLRYQAAVEKREKKKGGEKEEEEKRRRKHGARKRASFSACVAEITHFRVFMTRGRRTGPVLAKGEGRKGKKTPNYAPGTVSPLFLVSHSGERTLSASPYRYKTRRNTIYPIQYCNAASLPASSVMFSICLPCYSGRRPKFDAFSGADPRFLLSLSLSLSLFSSSPRRLVAALSL